MKHTKKIVFVAIIILIIIAILLTRRQFRPKQITNFAECAAAGNPVMESYPRQCRANNKTFVEQIDGVALCALEQRNAEVCAQIYSPVCAKVNIQCIKAPCNPIWQTFSNACEACSNSLVENYAMGACEGGQE